MNLFSLLQREDQAGPTFFRGSPRCLRLSLCTKLAFGLALTFIPVSVYKVRCFEYSCSYFLTWSLLPCHLSSTSEEPTHPAMSSVKLSLMCIVWPRLNDSEKPDEDTFEVNIDNDETIASLKNLIKLKCAPKFDKFIAVDLVLWKCSIPADDDLQESLNTIRFDGTNTRFGLLRLPPICKISEYFATGLPSKTIHILVKRPDYGKCGTRISSYMLNALISSQIRTWNTPK